MLKNLLMRSVVFIGNNFNLLDLWRMFRLIFVLGEYSNVFSSNKNLINLLIDEKTLFKLSFKSLGVIKTTN